MAQASVLYELLQLRRLTEVVDIGASPIDGDPPYTPMLRAGLCRVTGCEPHGGALAILTAKKTPNERYLPYAVGDGERHELKICVEPGMTSLLEPDPYTLALFDHLRKSAEIVDRIRMDTRRLDDITEIENIDYLKIDVQGSELSVFNGGRSKLAQTTVIQTEVSFIPLYKKQPIFADVDSELRRQGFLPHCFAAVKKWAIAPCVLDGNPRKGLNQLLEADIVYVRDITRIDAIPDEQLKQLTLIAHHCYDSIDLAMRCIAELEARDVLPKGSLQDYIGIVNAGHKFTAEAT